MMRAWTGVALLSASWLFGTAYYHEAERLWWALCVVAGAILLGSATLSVAPQLWASAGILLLPPVVLTPWPYKAAPLLMLVGIIGQLAPSAPKWVRWVGGGALAGGIV